MNGSQEGQSTECMQPRSALLHNLEDQVVVDAIALRPVSDPSKWFRTPPPVPPSKQLASCWLPFAFHLEASFSLASFLQTAPFLKNGGGSLWFKRPRSTRLDATRPSGPRISAGCRSSSGPVRPPPKSPGVSDGVFRAMSPFWNLQKLFPLETQVGLVFFKDPRVAIVSREKKATCESISNFANKKNNCLTPLPVVRSRIVASLKKSDYSVTASHANAASPRLLASGDLFRPRTHPPCKGLAHTNAWIQSALQSWHSNAFQLAI